MNASTRITVVGRRLRRYLGALLAVGFGAAWWSFVPRASVAEAAPPPVVASRPPVAKPIVKVLIVPTLVVVPVAPKPRAKPTVIAKLRSVATPVAPTFAVPPPRPPTTRTPVVAPPPTPVVETPPPVVEEVPHVVEDPPVAVDEPPPPPRIRTRSS